MSGQAKSIVLALNIFTIISLHLPMSNGIDLGNVIFSNIIFRHGDRTPVSTYPSDPYGNLSYWPTGWGQLTSKGMEGHFELGKWLRARYSNLLPIKYSKDDIYVQSTDVDRTLMSAYCNLAGLYEPDPKKNWNPDILWQPIPVHTSPEKFDVLGGKRPCPRYQRLYSDLLKSEEIQKILTDNQFLRDAMTVGTGKEIITFKDIEDVYNTLSIENMFNFSLPTWTKNIFPQPMKNLADFSFTLEAYTADLARLIIGPVLSEMVKEMDKKLKKSSRKIHIYSAHDTTVANFLQTLRVFDVQSPPYFSTILIELREKNEKHYVTAFYRNSSEVPPYLLTIPGCAPLCPFGEFKQIVKNVIPEDWDTECRMTLLQRVTDVTGISVIAYTCVSSITLLVLIVIFQKWRKRPPLKDSFLYQSVSVEAS